MKKTYLSIDIDFWNRREWGGNSRSFYAKTQLTALFEEAQRQGIPIKAVMNHQQLTQYVDKSKARTLINVDTHSDLCDFNIKDFECGSWVSYIRWRARGKYIWYHSLDVDTGECNSDDPIFEGSHRPRTHKTEWRQISRRKVKGIPSVKNLLENCVEIGFVMSPAYSDPELIELFNDLVKKFKIPYKSGRLDEDVYHIRRRPPFRYKKAA